VSAEHIALFKVHRATRGQIRRKLLLPSALPSIFTGFEMAVVFSTLGAIVGEFVGAQAGLGVLILQAQYRMNTGAVFACLLILCAVGITLNVIVRIVRRRILYWVPGEKSLKV
jgi:NitT/TauT family transport system permease protein